MSYVIVLLLLALIGVQVGLIKRMEELRQILISPHLAAVKAEEEESEAGVEEPVEYVDDADVFAQKRQEEFQQRIERIKNQLAEEQESKSYKGYPAQELHPDVHNLPHDTVDEESYKLPSVEYAD